jgi:hypothetical protein
MKTVLVFEDDLKELPMENIYIASIHVEPATKAFSLQPADVTGVQPHPFLREQHPDIFRNSYLVLDEFEKIPGCEGFPLGKLSLSQMPATSSSSAGSSTW